MSYIHEALNKAQRERDSRYRRYGIVSVRGKKTNLIDKMTFRIISLIIFGIFIAFALYSWLDYSIYEKSPVSGIKNEDPEPAARLMSAVTTEQNFEKAKEFHRKGSLREAVTLYREVLTTDPGHIDALNNLGVIYLHSNDFDMAGANFEKAIRLNPENVNSFYNMACLNARKGELSRSLVNLKKALSLDQSVREWAKNDTDLKNLHGELEFENMISARGIRNAGFE